MHIVIVNRWPRFRDERRWDNELTRYEDFFDHQQHRISYVVDAPGAEGVLAPAQHIAHQVQVSDVNQYEQLLGAVQQVIERVGPVDRLGQLQGDEIPERADLQRRHVEGLQALAQGAQRSVQALDRCPLGQPHRRLA